MLILRDYQQKCVDGLIQKYSTKHKAPLLVVPTGGGKTVIFSNIAHRSVTKKNKVWILVHRVELLRQTSEALTTNGVEHGLVNPQYTPAYYKDVQVASVQSIVKRLHHLDAPNLIIIDEAHHATATTWRKIIEAYPNAKILGVTATPCRSDGKGLGTAAGGVFDSIVIGPQVSELIAAKFLVEPVVYGAKQAIDLSGVGTVAGDYNTKQVEERVDKPRITGDAVEHYKKVCPGVPTVVFCVTVKHAEHVAEQFTAAGFRAFSVDGTMDDDTRKKLINGLADGTVDIITSCNIISEGTDVPKIGAAILLRPTQSLGLYLQQVGRALRPSEGKQFAVILDHVGNYERFGLPTDDREWSLDGEVKKKGKKAKQDAALKTSQCLKCYGIYKTPAPACPHCGHVASKKERGELEVIEGELKPITAADLANLRKRQEVAKARTLAELREVAKRRGYKSTWADHIWRARQAKESGI